MAADSDIGNAAAYNSALSSSPVANASFVSDGIAAETGSSPGSDHSKPGRHADHSRRVSWDDTVLGTAGGGGAIDPGANGLTCVSVSHQHADCLLEASGLNCFAHTPVCSLDCSASGILSSFRIQ